MPFLVIGRTARIAWTFTTTGADTQDVFTRTVLPDGRYATPDGPAAFTIRTEHIAVRGGPGEDFTVRETRHGPVVSDLARYPARAARCSPRPWPTCNPATMPQPGCWRSTAAGRWRRPGGRQR